MFWRAIPSGHELSVQKTEKLISTFYLSRVNGGCLKTNSESWILKALLVALILATWVFISVGCIPGIATSEEERNRTFGGSFLDVGSSVQQTTDGGYIIAGAPYWYGPVSFDVLPLKIDFNGYKYLKSGWVSDVIPEVTNSFVIISENLSIGAADDTVVRGMDMVLTVQGVPNSWFYVVVTNVSEYKAPEIKPVGDVKALSGNAVISAGAPNLAAWLKTGSDGIADFKVSTTAADQRTYTIKVYKAPEDARGPLLPPDDPGGAWANDADIVAFEDSDSVNVTVMPPTVTFDVPATAIIGEKVNINGAIDAGRFIDVIVKNQKQIANDKAVDENKEFTVEWDTSGMTVGSYTIEGYIDDAKQWNIYPGDYASVDPDGSITIRLIYPGLTATQPRAVVAEGDNYYFEGTATGVNAVDYVLVGPKGWKTGHAATVLGGIVKGAASVYENEFSENETMTEGLDLGSWIAVVLHPGRDNEYTKTGGGGGSLTLAALGVIAGKSQSQILEIIEDAIYMAGSDDQIEMLAFDVDAAQEIRFTGRVTAKNPPGQPGALWWNVTVEEIISGPQTSCATLRVDLVPSPPIGYYESHIDVGDRVGVYGNYISHFCTVSLNGESYYIVAFPSVHNLNTSEDFATIQAAIDDANTLDGHMILVDSGTYPERVNVTKQLILRGNDTGGGQPVVDADDIGSAITLSHDGIVLDGFTAINATNYPQAGISISSNNNIIINNTASNNYFGIILYASSNNTLTNNTALNNFDGIGLFYAYNNTLTGNTANLNKGAGIQLVSSSNNTLKGNTANLNSNDGILLVDSSNNTLTNNSANSNTYNGIILYFSSNNTMMGNIASNSTYGIEFDSSSNNAIYNNYFDNPINAYDGGINIWNISKTAGPNILGGSWLGGNYWSDYTGEDINGDGFGDIPYDIPGGTNKDYLPLVVVAAPHMFDTGNGAYPSISGTHNGTITPCCDLRNITKLYTYSYPGSGGHTEYVKIWNSTGWNVTATWNGYTGDWHNLTFDEPFPESANQTYNSNLPSRGGGGGAPSGQDYSGFTLYANETYNYTIRTGSYPQIIHGPSWNATGGVITCEEFVDVNGKRHEHWIPAIRLY
ncbi:MAG: right-handed parallel beta-helix repeat-containing protein [Candidatus Methanospirareceae archaeon]